MKAYFNKEFVIAAVIRSIRTIAQTALSFLVVGMTLVDVDWITVISTSALAGIISILTSVATGLPETSDMVGDLIVVEDSTDGDKPQLLLELDDEKVIETLKKKNFVKMRTKEIK